MRRTSTTLLGVLLVALSLGLAACGGDDDDEAAPQETAATTPAAEQELNTEDIGPTKDVIPEGDTVQVAFFTVAGNTYQCNARLSGVGPYFQ